jgi:pimeloyl-ACP methyl ester carboxylesterase
MKEQVVTLGKFQSLIGVITEPDPAVKKMDLPAVILLNAGLIHRVGPNRFYVRIARSLAEMGFTTLRLDLSGIGDSKVRPDNLPFEKSNVDDTRQAMDYLSEKMGFQKFLLMGHCGGGINSFKTAQEDTRVAGVVIINPEGGDEQWDEYDLKRKLNRYYQNYYTKTALFNPQSWRKLLTGKASYGNIARNVFKNMLWNRISTGIFTLKKRLSRQADAPDPVRESVIAAWQSLIGRNTRMLFVYADNSTGLKQVQAVIGKDLDAMTQSGKVRFEVIPGADNTFTLRDSQEKLFKLLREWALEASPVRA